MQGALQCAETPNNWQTSSSIAAMPILSTCSSNGLIAATGHAAKHLKSPPHMSQNPLRKSITGTRALMMPSERCPTPMALVGHALLHRSQRMQSESRLCSSCAPGGRRRSPSPAKAFTVPPSATSAPAAMPPSIRLRRVTVRCSNAVLPIDGHLKTCKSAVHIIPPYRCAKRLTPLCAGFAGRLFFDIQPAVPRFDIWETTGIHDC